MRPVIISTSKIIGNGHNSSIDIAAQAVGECIEKSGVDKRDIGLFINIGLHRDKNIVEPAVASLIQKKLHLNVNPTSKQLEKGKGTFSFDLINGRSGFFSAIQVIDSFFKGERCDKAIIVASDIHPSGTKAEDFPFTPSGAAMLLEPLDNGKGFKDVIYKTSDEDIVGVEQYLDPTAHGSNARNSITVVIDKNYDKILKKQLLDTFTEYIEKGIINLDQVDHVIASTHSNLLAQDVFDSLGYKKKKVIDIYEKYGDTNTSSLIIGYHDAVENGEIKVGDKIFFMSGGSDLSVAFSLYDV